MEIPVFVLVALWFAVACFGVLAGVAIMAIPSMLAWLRRTRQLAQVQSHHLPPQPLVRRMNREALVLEGETIFFSE